MFFLMNHRTSVFNLEMDRNARAERYNSSFRWPIAYWKKSRPTSMTMYTDNNSPKVKHLAHAGNVVQYFIFMGKVVREVWLYMG